MSTITKIIAGATSVLALGGIGTSTYYGLQNQHLKAEHEEYVTAQEKKNEDLANKIVDLQLALKNKETLQEELNSANATIAEKDAKIAELEAEIERLNAEIAELEAVIESNVKDVSEYSMLSFACDETTKTATVSTATEEANSETHVMASMCGEPAGLAVGEIEVPSKIKKDGKVYTVNTVGNFGYCELGILILNLPETIEYISINASFSSIEMHVPASVSKIGIFADMPDAVYIKFNIDENNPYFKTDTSGKVIISKEDNRLHWISGGTFSIDIPEGVEILGKNSQIYSCMIEELTIARSVNKIEAGFVDGIDFADYDTEVTFKETTGWKAGDVSISSDDLADSSKAYELMKQYSNVDWVRTI